MSRRVIILSTTVGALLAITLTTSLRRAGAAEQGARSARSTYEQAVADANEVLALRGRRPVIAAAEHPTRDLIARINDVLNLCGLSSRIFSSLTPESDVKLDVQSSDRSIYRRQSLRLSLMGVEPPEIGSFLASWREAQPLWSISRIELTHQRSREADTPKYDVTLVLSSIYVSYESSS